MNESQGSWFNFSVCVHQVNRAIVQNWIMKTVQIHIELYRWEMETEVPPAWGKMEVLHMQSFRAYPPISVTLMLWNISNASLLVFCETRGSLSLLYNEPWSLLDQCALNWKEQCPSRFFFLFMAEAWALIRKTQSHIITLDETKEDNPVVRLGCFRLN